LAYYWSSTTNAGNPFSKWVVSMSYGGASYDWESAYYYYGWPVRAGE
jgi:hypothetical protein